MTGRKTARRLVVTRSANARTETTIADTGRRRPHPRPLFGNQLRWAGRVLADSRDRRRRG